jgi:Ca-activated chloride channel family protein
MKKPSRDGARWVASVLAMGMLFFISFAGGAKPQILPAAEGQDPGSFKISVNVDLVVLNPTVRDRKGRFVSDLRERDFEVYEDGVRQAIRLFRHEDIPVTVGLVIDHSGSMQSKLPEVIAAARTFVQTSNPEDRMFVVNFNEKVTLGLPGRISFTNRSEELERAISSMPARGMTALYDGVIKALERLQTGSGNDKTALIIISDGGDNASKHSMGELLKMAEQSSALMYAIGVFDEEDPDRNPGVLNRLARATGGEAFFPGKLAEVIAICENIAREIRNQYTIGYVSSNAAPTGGYRKIRVVAAGAEHGKLSVRTRAGYIAGSEPHPEKHETAK